MIWIKVVGYFSSLSFLFEHSNNGLIAFAGTNGANRFGEDPRNFDSLR